MKTLRVLALLSALLFAAPSWAAPRNRNAGLEAIPAQFTGKVTRVLDGDSLEVRYKNFLVPVQLYSIDAPELGQPFGKTAREYSRVACLGKVVTIYGERVVGKTLLAVVRVNGKGVLNELLLNEGIAWLDRPHGKSARLAKLEANARRARRGLWRDKSPVAPWEWRRKR